MRDNEKRYFGDQSYFHCVDADLDPCSVVPARRVRIRGSLLGGSVLARWLFPRLVVFLFDCSVYAMLAANDGSVSTDVITWIAGSTGFLYP